MFKLYMTLLVCFLGNDEWAFRDAAQRTLEGVAYVSEDIGPVLDGLRSDDAEVRRRCGAVVDAYEFVPYALGIPPLCYFDGRGQDLWHECNSLPTGEDGVCYVHLLRTEVGLSRTEVTRKVVAAHLRQAQIHLDSFPWCWSHDCHCRPYRCCPDQRRLLPEER